MALLSAQYEAEGKLSRVIHVGDKPPTGRWFPRFFVSPNYIIPKKKKIGQPQKWRLIHNLSDHSLGHRWSINAGIKKAEFPVTYPSIVTAAHEVFCRGTRGCVLWGRDLKAYYRHLMINPAFWWCTGTTLEGQYYVDCYCPFGARSMPAVFQRLSDAIRVIMLQKTPVDSLLGMLDDFLGIVYRKHGETDTDLLKRSQISAIAFDRELQNLGISKQPTKDSPPAWTTVWLGFEINSKDQTLAIPSDKESNIIQVFQEDFFDDRGGLLPVANTVKLGKLVGSLCHMSQAWSMGKTLLWPLYQILAEFREVTPEGKTVYRKAQVELGYDGAASMMEWYERINTCGIYKKFFTCTEAHPTTTICLWCGRKASSRSQGERTTGGIRKIKAKNSMQLITPWGTQKKYIKDLPSLKGLYPSAQKVAVGICLLLELLNQHGGECDDIILIKTNVGAFAQYITKDCYPKGLAREHYLNSLQIQPLFSKSDSKSNEERER